MHVDSRMLDVSDKTTVAAVQSTDDRGVTGAVKLEIRRQLIITEVIHAFASFVDGSVGIAVVGDVVALVALVQVVVAGRRVVTVVFESAVAAVGHRVVVVGAILVEHVAVGFQLPQRVLRVDGAAVVRVGVAVLRVGHVDTCRKDAKRNATVLDAARMPRRSKFHSMRYLRCGR